MNRDFDDRAEVTSLENWVFVEQMLGRPAPRIVSRQEAKRIVRARLVDRATLSDAHAEELRRFDAAEAKARHDREVLEFAASISPNAAAELRALERTEAERHEEWLKSNQDLLVEWNEADHPRHPKGSSAGGQWAPKGGGGVVGASGGRGARKPAASSSVPDSTSGLSASQNDPAHWYLPSDDKGEWLGARGDSTFRLKKAVTVNGKLERDIPFVKGLPVLDKFALPGKTATIILTGDHDIDRENAKTAWRILNPGKQIPDRATFHHDLLQVTEEITEIDGKKVKVLVGKMQLVPSEVNGSVFHQGSASAAKKYYQGLDIDVRSVAELAKREARVPPAGSKIVSNGLKKIKPGKVPKGIASLVGRSITRAIPFVGTGLAILEFTENVEAHGVAGAVARATPLLGDLIGAYDLGSELANQLRDQADKEASATQYALNEPSRRAWEEADAQTIAAYKDLATQIRVTNSPQSGETGGLVDPEEVASALADYREAMQNANLRRATKVPGFDFKAAAAHNKQVLRKRLEHASQKRGPVRRGPLS